MPIFKVTWTEDFSAEIEAETEEDACDVVRNGDIDPVRVERTLRKQSLEAEPA